MISFSDFDSYEGFNCPDNILGNTPNDYGRFPHEYDCTLFHACYRVSTNFANSFFFNCHFLSMLFQGVHLLSHCPEGMGFRVTGFGQGECDLINLVESCEHKAWNLIDWKELVHIQNHDKK